MYVAEITPYNLRGAFGTAHQLFVTIGIFMGSVFGIKEILGELLFYNNRIMTKCFIRLHGDLRRKNIYKLILWL